MSNSLWGEIPLNSTIRTPKAILEAQGQELTTQTRGVLEGIVVVEKSGWSDRMLLRLYIRVPALNNYMYEVCGFSYPMVEFYPCTVIDPGDGMQDNVENEGQIYEALRRILQSERVRRAIQGLLAQANV